MWVIRTALSVVFTLWPPGPEERNTSTRMSLSSIFTSTSSASGSTATVAAEVWIRPWVSVAGTRCTRCTPDSRRSRPKAPSPRTATIASLRPPSVPSLSDIGSQVRRVPLAEPLVHAVEVGREERGLVAAGAGADLDDGVAGVVRVLRAGAARAAAR